MIVLKLRVTSVVKNSENKTIANNTLSTVNDTYLFLCFIHIILDYWYIAVQMQKISTPHSSIPIPRVFPFPETSSPETFIPTAAPQSRNLLLEERT